MNPAAAPATAAGPPRARIRLAAALIVAAVLAAYHNSFGVPFLFDDLPAILENPSIRRLGALGEVLFPGQAGGLTTSGRPVVSLSLALNYAVGGYGVSGYHAVNLAIHAACALLLLGIVRRTLGRPVLQARFGAGALPIAAASALLWALHPLQTAAVTYLVQRAESLAAMFVLLALYAFIRAEDSAGAAAGRWRAASVGACLLGMASKETAVAGPLLVLLYARTFVHGTFRAAWRARCGYYLALAATWGLLVWLVVRTHGRGGTAGFGADVSAWHYALTQCGAIVRYLALVAWPAPLVFDYGLGLARELGEVLQQALLVAALVAGVVAALVRRPALGFAGAWLLLLLAPSSSFVPVATQTMAEHRMYLASAAPVALAVLLASALLGRRALSPVAAAALAAGLAAFARNSDYRGELAIWRDTAAKRPENARAHNNLGQALFRAGDLAGALARYDAALALQPRYPESHYNRGTALAALGRLPGAIAAYGEALRLEPRYPEARNNLANALVRAGRAPEALAHYEAALAQRPEFAEAHNNLGNALLAVGRAAEAMARFRRALELKPGYAEASYNLGNAHAAAGAMADALAHYDRAVAVQPDYAAAHVNAGNALLELRRAAEAERRYEIALALDPRLADAHFNLASVRLDQGRWAEAAASLEAALRVDSSFVRAHRALGFALANLGRVSEAERHYERYLAAMPDDAAARAELGRLRLAPR